jgi:hypothetical protein
MQRAIPSSGEMLPVISFGARPADPAAIKEVLTTLLGNGGRGTRSHQSSFRIF